MKKVLIALGIGCGVILVGGVIAANIIPYTFRKYIGDPPAWAKKFAMQQEKVKALDAMFAFDAQQEKFKALDSQFAFAAPPEGQLHKLDEARLQAYFEICKLVMAVFKEFEEQSESLQHDGNKGHADRGDVMLDLTYKVRDTYITGLEAKKMSPREFHTIFWAIYSTAIKAGQEKAATETAQQRAELETKLNDPATSDADKVMLKAQLEAMEAQEKMTAGLAGMAHSDPATVAANEVLIAKYKSDVDAYANPALDAFLADENTGKSFMQMK